MKRQSAATGAVDGALPLCNATKEKSVILVEFEGMGNIQGLRLIDIEMSSFFAIQSLNDGYLPGRSEVQVAESGRQRPRNSGNYCFLL